MADASQEWQIALDGGETSALYEPAASGDGTIFVCAHGAGGHMRDRSMNALAESLVERGIAVVRFNFHYREQGSRRPDPMPRLERCMGAVIDHARRALNPRLLLIGGRSMGGRTGSMLAAAGMKCDGLLLFAYPLHPAGKPEKLRNQHLPNVTVPVLCFNGTRDALCRRDLMENTLSSLGTHWRMHWIDGADHGFHVLKSSGRTDAEVTVEIADAVEKWVSELGKRAAPSRASP